jgi:beta-glucosidase
MVRNRSDSFQGWGSGTAQFPYLIAPLDAIKTQASTDGTVLTTSTSDTPSAGASAAASAATALVFINADSGEGYITVEGNAGDRNNLDPWHNGNDLVAAVAAVNKKTIVVIHSVGPLILESILALPSVVAVVWAGIPGQESGNGLVDILYGSTSPSGKLPFTIAKAPADYGTSVVSGDDSFPEGLFIDYTTFSYSNLSVSALSAATPSAGIAPGGLKSLYDVVATVSATITNNGTVEGKEVAQLYISLPSGSPGASGSPIKQLRGFSKLDLKPGVSGKVIFQLRRKDLSYWDTGSKSWIMPTGKFGVVVGASSRDGRLTGTLGS